MPMWGVIYLIQRNSRCKKYRGRSTTLLLFPTTQGLNWGLPAIKDAQQIKLKYLLQGLDTTSHVDLPLEKGIR